MDKLSYGTFDISNGDIAFASSNGYSEPSSELERRKQLSYPLKEVKTFVNNTVSVKGSDAVQLVVTDDNTLQYRTDPNGTLTDIESGSSLPTGGTAGQVLKKKSSTDYDVEWGNNTMQSFVGMVVSGTNLTTEASVKTIYGGTSWALLSSVILASNHVYGNGKALGLTNNANKAGFVGNISGQYILGQLNTEGYGKNTTNTQVTGGTNLYGVFGVPTKEQANGEDDKTGLIVDTRTVYTWERTA